VKKKLALRNQEIEWSGIRTMLALANEQQDVINLGIGEPDFPTSGHIKTAAKNALDQGYTTYPPARGYQDLREAIAEKLKDENRIIADPDSEIFVSVGAMQGIFNTALHLIEPGDEVIVLDPGYDYYSQIRMFGGIPVPVAVHESHGFRLDPETLERAITPKTKMMIINTPANPTGAVFGKSLLQDIAALAKQYEIMVLSDEPYETIIYDGKKHFSIASLDGMKGLTISVFTFSKTYAMTGWRVGYVVAPHWLVDEMEKVMEHMVSGVTAVSQRAALAALNGPRECVAEMVEAYSHRRKIIHDGLNAIKGVSSILPESTFYAFPNISGLGMTSWEVAEFLVKEYQVATVPGTVFGKNGEGFLRISFAVDTSTIEEGLSRIEQGIVALRKRGVK
jgi:aminotransferase